jgi:hypothetical protein
VFSLKLVARPDARMVEVPLEIEAELPREFEGAALLASSGLPRRVRIRAAKDALKLSTAYRADQLVGEIVRTALRGTSGDIQRVQDAVMKFVRTVRERRQDGATLVVSSNGRGKIEVLDLMSSPRPLPPAAPAPAPGAAHPVEPLRSPVAPDRTAMLERRVAELESTIARLATGGDLLQRISQLEQRLAPAMAQISRTLSTPGIAGPGQENQPGRKAAARTAPSARRATAIEAYAEGLRGELRERASGAAARARADLERCDRAAALAVDAELLGAPPDGTSQRLREASAQVAARQSALEKLAEEIEFYAGSDLPVAGQLLARLDEASTRDPAPSLEPLAQAIVRATKGEKDSDSRTAWLQRAAALCGWQLVTPAPGDAVQPQWHHAVDSGGDTVVALACPGVKRVDGSLIVEARVNVDPATGPQRAKSALEPPPPPPDPEASAAGAEPAPSAVASGSPAPVEAPAMAAAPDGPMQAAETSPAPSVGAPPPAAPEAPFALLPPATAAAPVEPSSETPIASEEAAAAAAAAARAVRIVSEDPAMNDEALAAEVALAVAQPAGVDEVHGDLVDAEDTLPLFGPLKPG